MAETTKHEVRRPCPFCGYNRVTINRVACWAEAQCDTCGARSGLCANETAAAETWDSRVESRQPKLNPRRHQRSRKKGSRLPDGVVCVTRPGRWGNPFDTAGEFLELLEAMLGVDSPTAKFPLVDVRKFNHVDAIARNLHELRGKDLACWCDLNQECHADVLIKLANIDPDDEAVDPAP